MEKEKTGKIVALSDYREKIYNAETERLQNAVGERIAQARKDKDLSLSDLSEMLRAYGVTVSGGGINKWELGKSVPNAYQLMAICVALGLERELTYFMKEYHPLLNREGLRKLEEYKADLVATGRYKPETGMSNTIRYVEKPVSTMAVSAGTGEFLDEQNFEMIQFPENSVPPDADFGLRVAGDSMEPVYHDGQIVWVQQAERVNVGEVGIFIYNGEGYLKVYGEQTPSEEQAESFADGYGNVGVQPVLISFNQAYAPKAVEHGSDFRIVGRVL